MTRPATLDAGTSPGAPAIGPPAVSKRAQLAGLLRLETRKNLLGARIVPLLLLAGLPVALLVLQLLLPFPDEVREGIDGGELFAGLYRAYFLKVAIFAGCLVVFVQLFRGDLMERSLHYYFLCPLRRELLVVAKYAAGVLATGAVLTAATAASYLLAVLPFSGPPPGAVAGQLFTYVGITLLACAGYGAVFMLAGLYVKNPVIPALALFLWELANPFLPALLKKASVIYYLSSLLPVQISVGPFAVLADLAPPWVAIPGLVAVAALALVLAARRIRRLEITYSDD